MRKKILEIRRSDFGKNVFTVTSGVALSQIIPILFTPLITRIYSPERYGELGIYLALTGVLGIFASFRYSQAILITKEDRDADVLLSFSSWSTLLVGILLLIVFVFWGDWITDILGFPEIKKWMYLCPLAFVATGLNESYSIYSNRKKIYRTIMYYRVAITLLQVALNILLGLYMTEQSGLIISFIIAQVVGAISIMVLTHSLFKVNSFKIYPWNDYHINLKRFGNFPKFSLPASIINYFSLQLPVFMMGAYAVNPGASIGAYIISTRVLGLPSQLVAGSVGEVFRQRAARDYNETNSCRAIFVKTFKALFFFSIIPFVVIAITAPYLFPFIFGKEWDLAGQFTQVLCFLYFMRFAVSPLSYVVYIRGKQHIGLLMDIYLFVSNFMIFYISFNYFSTSILFSVLLYSVNYGLLYLVTLSYSYKFTENKKLKNGFTIKET